MTHPRAFSVLVACIALGTTIASPAGAAHRAAPVRRSFVSVSPDVKAFGDANFVGSTNATMLNQPIVGLAGTASASGYWLVASDGGVFTFGDAKFFGSMGGMHLNQPVVGIAATPTGAGYWLVASDGGIFTFGDAKFRGSMGGMHLNQPVVGMAVTLTGAGYWLVASDGGIFTLGDAKFFGSLGNAALGQFVGMAARPGSDGYWIADSVGHVYAFGQAHGLGDAVGADMTMPIVAIVATESGNGFWLVGSPTPAVLAGQVSEPGCAPDGSQRAVRPADFMLACGDGNSRVADARWDVWTADHAAGIGLLVQNDCEPNCAAGHFHSQTADLTLFQPVVFHGNLVFSQLRIHLHGPLAPLTMTTFTLTLV